MTDDAGREQAPTDAASPRDPGGSSSARHDAPPPGEADPGSGLAGPLGGLVDDDGPSAGRGQDGGDPAVTAAAAQVLRDRATSWFEPLYDGADRDPARIPWAHLEPDPLVVGWLEQPGLDVTGVDAAVVGCGLGDDAVELARRGCRVTAFDLSPTAVDWARERFADEVSGLAGSVAWEVVDVLDLPDRLVGSFGLVVEVRTVQSLPASVRDDAMLAIASLVGPGGYLVATTLLATSDEAARTRPGPPWAQAPAELAAYRAGGLERLSLEHPPVEASQAAMEVRLVFHRPDPAIASP